MLTMCKHLAELLDAEQPHFSIMIEQLERASGKPSIDVRLTAEIIGKVHQKTRALGLDPTDTTGKELYLALKEMAKKHDEFIARRLGVDDPTDVFEVLPKLKAFAEQLDIPKTTWAIKHSVAKRLLRDNPPKKVMKQLGYRSIESMIKRQPLGEIFAAIRCFESKDWQANFVGQYKNLTPQDFESRTIEFVYLDESWSEASKTIIASKGYNLTHLKELGVIVILPLPVNRLQGLCVTVLPLILHYVNEIRLYSAYFKLQQVSPKFGEILSETILNDPGQHAFMGGQDIHWRTIQRHFGKQESANHPEIFEPHLRPEDLDWYKAEEILYRLEPALYFWHDMDYVGTVRDGHVISFNLMDIAACYMNDLPYGHQTSYYMKESLNNEIHVRYLGQKILETQVLKQLTSRASNSEATLFDLLETV